MRWNYASVEDRFYQKVHPEPNTGCWIWGGGLAYLDYGTFFYEGRLQPAHRVSYMLERGTIPEGLHVDHLCRNHWCVNPDHLEPVTRSENSIRGIGPAITKARHEAKTHCVKGHERSGDNLRIYVSPSGRTYRICVQCRLEQDRAQKKRAKERNRKCS